jgi:hypothetical protein
LVCGMKTCVTCKHHEIRTYTDRVMFLKETRTYHKCTHKLDIVTGEKSHADCYEMRAFNELCGFDGKWWESRE